MRWDRLFENADSFEKHAGPGHRHVDFDHNPMPHLNQGDAGNEIAFVFAAPGRYRITNSVSKIMYDEQDDGSEPSDPKIKEEGNLDRFAGEISRHTIIICFGECAWIAATTKFPPSEQATANGSWYRAGEKLFIKIAHLSQRGLNQIRNADLPGITQEMVERNGKTDNRLRHELRLKVCATEILVALCDSGAWKGVPTSKTS